MKNSVVTNKEVNNEGVREKMNLPDAVELLQMMTDQGIIDIGDAAKAIEMNKRKVVEQMHTRAFYQDGRGRYCTTISDNTKKDGRRMIARSTEEGLIDALYRHYMHLDHEKENARLTLRTFFPQWLQYKRDCSISEATVLKYESDWRRFLDKSSIADVPLIKLNKQMLDAWAHKLIKDNGMTKKTYVNVSTLVRQPLDYAVWLEIIPNNPMDFVKIAPREYRPVKKKASETQIFLDEELQKVEEIACNDLGNDRLVYPLTPLALLMMKETGMRIGEVVVVKYSDVENGQLHVQRMWVRDLHEVKDKTKGKAGERYIPLTHRALELIEDAKRRQDEAGVNTEYIFSMTEWPCSYRALSDRFYRYCDLAGIPIKSSHKMRKTAITRWIESGMSINSAREIAGHESESTTLGNYLYDSRTVEQRRAIMEM